MDSVVWMQIISVGVKRVAQILATNEWKEKVIAYHLMFIFFVSFSNMKVA